MTEQHSLEYTRDDRPPHLLAALLAAQTVALILAPITLTPIIVLRAAGGEAEAFASWLVFAALLVSGLATLLQVRPIGPIGSGYLLFMGTSGAFIAICIAAIQAGGLPLMGSLIIASALVQFFFAARLSRLRKLVTPTVGGIVIMLISVTVFPVCFSMLQQTPDVANADRAALLSAASTFVIIVGMAIFSRGSLRLWSPILGVIAGCLVAWLLGIFDLGAVEQAPLIGLPNAQWPGLDVSFGATFWSLLPGFLIVTIIGAVETYGDGIAIQRISHKKQRPIDFKAVQGAVYADGIGNLVAGAVGTLPNTTYSTGVSITEMTGVSALRVGIYGGLFLIALAFSPKISALLQSIPAPVAGVYIMLLLVFLFLHGLRLVAESGLSQEDGLIIGLAFWLGTGFQNQLIFPELMPAWAHRILDNGMTAGGLVAISLTALVALKRRAADKIVLAPVMESVPSLHAFLHRLARTQSWDTRALRRLELVAEEAFSFVLENRQANPLERNRVHCWIRPEAAAIEFEFVATGSGRQNLEHLTSKIRALKGEPALEDIGPGLLRHLASEIRHLQFHDADCLTLKVPLTAEKRGSHRTSDRKPAQEA
jgi:NCS2 family nucleobase:cation symporter-2/xanthine permease XanP